MQQNEISEEELYCAKQSLANVYRSLYDSAEGLEVWYLRRILSNCILAPEEAAVRVMDIPADAIAKVARGVSLDTVYFLRGDNSTGYFEADEDDEWNEKH